MPSLVSLTGAHAMAIKGDSGEGGGGGVLLTCMMDDQSTEDNVNAIRDVACIMSAQQFSCFAFALYVRITLISNQQ